MNRLRKTLATLTLLVSTVPIGAVLAGERQAVCVVCQVLRGESTPEPVKASRTHQGIEYGLCSARCAKAFDEDPAGFVPAVLPRPAPGFALEDLGGTPISNETLKGAVALVDFWATWCAPCRKSMPDLEALHKEYAPRGLRVVGVSIDEAGRDKVAAWLKGRKITYPIAVDGTRDPAWAAFGVKAVPAAYLIDRQGRIVAQWTGAAADLRELRGRLEEMLPTP